METYLDPEPLLARFQTRWQTFAQSAMDQDTVIAAGAVILVPQHDVYLKSHPG